ncbi:MAG TPA: AAA family ATPase [Polyangia bacterium]
MNVDDLVSRLDAKKNGTGHKAKCPAHGDTHASLSIRVGDGGKILVKCHAGCPTDAICDALGMKVADLFSDDAKRKQKATVADLAAHKKLTTAFLRDLGVHDLDRGGIGIPYRDCDGNVVSVKGRGSLVAKEGSWWVQGKPLAYGEDRLVVARELDYLVLVEGESDCWALWHAEIPALGVPGADLTKVITPQLLDGITKVYAIREPDKGGDTFIAGLTKQLGADRFTEVRLDGAKDPADLYAKDPATFKARFSAALEKARPSVDSSTFNLIAVRDIPEIVTQEWLIKGLVPRFPDDGTAGYIFAPAKFRKSMVLADWALSVSSGTPALGKFEVQHTGSVVGFFAEDPKGETSRRIHRMARARGIAVPPNLHLIDAPAIAIDSIERGCPARC